MNHRRTRIVACGCALLLAALSFRNVARAVEGPREPMHVRVDRLLDGDRVGPPIGIAGDVEFLRRVSLDLIGMPPSVEELRAFVADRDPNKRAIAVDRLLASPLFARHWATTLDVMLMERRGNDQVPDADWQAFLLDAARRNRPFNELAAELLRADGGDPKHRTPARFYLDRESEPNRITRDIGRIFFGRDLQCAQCHNHPLIEDYRQSDYQGLLAFFNSGSELAKMEGAKKTTFFPEKAAKDVAFDSVFVKDDHHLTGPRLPGGTEIDEPAVAPGDEYKVKPVGFVMPVPRHSRRAMLASIVASGNHQVFNENFANRLWAMMMGRGIVHPVDLGHPGNPPTHPELLAMLGREIGALKFDVKPFLRELALTRAYQKSIDFPASQPASPGSFASDLAELKSRTTLLEADAERAKDDYRKAEKAWFRAESTLIPLANEEQKAVAQHEATTKKEEEARTALETAQAAAAARRDSAKALAEASARAQEVVKKLPKEKDLVDAARVFATRSTAAATELAGLEKAQGEKAATLKRIGEERAAVARSIEAARAKMKPVRELVRREEAAALEARRKNAEGRVALENHQRRVAALEAFGKWQQVRTRIDDARREAAALEPSLAVAQTRAAEQAAVVSAREKDVRDAEAARTAAEKTRADAESAADRHRRAVAAVDAALQATRTAMSLIPGDAALAEAAGKLEARTNELRSVSREIETKIGDARAGATRAAEAVRTAGVAAKAAIAEKDRRETDAGLVREKIAAATTKAESLRAELSTAREELTTLLGNRFAMAQLKALTPEQFYWSLLKVTGVYDRTRLSAETLVDTGRLMAGVVAALPALRGDRPLEVEQMTHEMLKSSLPGFVSVYGAGAGQPQSDFFATADQALFASNGGAVNGWIAPAGGNVSQRMVEAKDPRTAAEDLYLTVLSRTPTADESADVVRMLTVPAKDRPAAVQELVWGLLVSVEFRFNH